MIDFKNSVFGTAFDPPTPTPAQLRELRESTPARPLHLIALPKVIAYRGAPDIGEEVYVVAASGRRAHPALVTRLPGTGIGWIATPPVAPHTGLPLHTDSTYHTDLGQALFWATRQVTSARFYWSHAVALIQRHFLDATHVTVSGELRDCLWVLEVFDHGESLWACGDEDHPFIQEGGEWEIDTALSAAYWRGLDPWASGWTPTDPDRTPTKQAQEFGPGWCVDLTAPVVTGVDDAA
ncbi:MULTISPECIES: hypothetical protein [Actinosynnema]|uniref:hypothetical protein n=1 Tax=Actinosynnema TaxID=40566 RepID=UPI0020A23DE7|nr:hypothetical protein [Actinosynnema pretiosum]MCP2097333.1 hypothetical protein [Actinosynnema pretiosum]